MWILCSVAVGRFAFVLVRSFSCIHNYYDIYIAIYICPNNNFLSQQQRQRKQLYALYFILYTLNCYFKQQPFPLSSRYNPNLANLVEVLFVVFKTQPHFAPLSLLLNIYTSFYHLLS